jgi:hypothetical protein
MRSSRRQAELVREPCRGTLRVGQDGAGHCDRQDRGPRDGQVDAGHCEWHKGAGHRERQGGVNNASGKMGQFMPEGVIGTFGSTTVAASVDQLSSLALALAFRRPSRLLFAFLAWLPLIVAPPPGDTWPSEDPPHTVYRGDRSRSRDGSSSGRAPGGGRSRDGTLGPGGRAPGGGSAPGKNMMQCIIEWCTT